MLKNIISYSVRNPIVVIIIWVFIVIYGVYAMFNLPLDAVPDITNNQVQVVTLSQSLPPQEMERYITAPIERQLANVPNVVEIRSITRFGLSVVTVVFEENIETLRARQLITEQLKILEEEIPAGYGRPELMPITTGLGEIYQYVLKVKPGYEHLYDLKEQRSIQDWIVKRNLAGIPGIIDISSFGGEVKQYEVAFDPFKMKQLNVSLDELSNALQNNNSNAGGSYILQGKEALLLRSDGLIKNINEIEKIAVKTNDGVVVSVSDIAVVREGKALRYGALTMDGKGEVIGGITLMLKNESSSKVIANVKERISQIEKNLPVGIEIYPYLDRSVLIGKAINTVVKNLVEGALIVVFVLLILLGNWRAALITASVIPISMLFAFGLMIPFNVSANLMSLGAIDFGIIIDGAIIIVEGVLHHLGLSKSKKLTINTFKEEIIVESSKIYRSALFGVLIILIVFAPILSFTGVEGKMFSPMALTVSFALLGSLLLSISYVPLMCSLFLNTDRKNWQFADRLNEKLKVIYVSRLNQALNKPKVWFISILIVFAVSVFGFIRLGGEFMPNLEEGDLAVQMMIKPGSSLEEMTKATSEVEKILLESFPEVLHVVSKIGSSEIPTDPMSIEEADIMIIMKPKKEWVSAKNRYDLYDKMKEILESGMPGAHFEFTQPIQLRFNELLTGSKADVSIKLFGDDEKILSKYGTIISNQVAQIEGVGDLKLEQTEGLPQLLVVPNKKQLALFDVDLAEVNHTIETAFAGRTQGVVYEGERKFDLVLRMDKNLYPYPNWDEIFIQNKQGIMIPMSNVVEMKEVLDARQISRENTRRRIEIGINVRGRDVASLVQDIRNQIDKNIQLPPDYKIEYGGQFENYNEASSRLAVAVPIALMIILALLYLSFQSFKQALLIFVAIPLSAIGGVAALYLRGLPFSISAGVGFIALFGVAVLNGIVMMAYFNQIKKEHPKWGLKKRIRFAASERLRPVIMTASVASLGFLPMALSTSAGAEVQRPLATLVIGGLISATILTLFILPIIYMWSEKGFKAKTKLLLLPFAFMFFSKANAQQTIENKGLSLQAAVDSALQNNYAIKNQKLRMQQALLERKKALAFGPTQVMYNYGQLEDVQMDYYWGFTQNLGSIGKQVQELTQAKIQFELQKDKLTLQNKIIKNEVSLLWWRWAIEKQKLETLESLMFQMNDLSNLALSQLKNGSIKKVNYLIVENKLRELTLQLEQQRASYISITVQMELITGLSNLSEAGFKEVENELINPNNINISSTLTKVLESELKASKQNISIQRAAFFPEISAGYFNQQLDQVPGLQGIMIGVSIPLWARPQLAQIKQAQIAAEIQENDINFKRREYAQQLQSLRLTILSLQKGLIDYQKSQKTLYEEVKNQAMKELKNGEISFFEYLTALSGAADTELNYWSQYLNLQSLITHYQYLTEE